MVVQNKIEFLLQIYLKMASSGQIGKSIYIPSYLTGDVEVEKYIPGTKIIWKCKQSEQYWSGVK